jgi:hypothetical protein
LHKYRLPKNKQRDNDRQLTLDLARYYAHYNKAKGFWDICANFPTYFRLSGFPNPQLVRHLPK